MKTMAVGPRLQPKLKTWRVEFYAKGHFVVAHVGAVTLLDLVVSILDSHPDADFERVVDVTYKD